MDNSNVENLFLSNIKEIMLNTEDNNKEITLEEICKSLKSNNYAILIFFNRFG